jgi:hypothetical protein
MFSCVFNILTHAKYRHTSIAGEGAKDTGIPKDFLLQVRGNDSHNTRATQVRQ